MRTNSAFAILVWLLVILLSGCAGTSATGSGIRERALSAAASEPGPGPYRLQAGDVIDIKFYYNDKLNERVMIRPDGKISLQLIGDVRAAGLTPEELRRVLLKRYAPYQRNLEVAVIVRDFARQKVYVGGEVRSPGPIPTFGNLTAIRAILAAGGFKRSAKLSSVVILRNRPGKTPLFMTVNLRQELDGAGKADDVVLHPYDVVFVPKTRIAHIDDFVDQYINQVLPFSRSVGFSWVKGLSSTTVVP